MSLALDASRARIASFLVEMRRLQGAEFPYSDSREALNLVEDYFAKVGEDLASVDPQNNPSAVEQFCRTSLVALFDYSPLLGFIGRSTNVRNAFEAYGPVHRLAESLLGQGAHLVLSSEWMYSPFTYHSVPELPDYVLIGLPASEASNPLLLPLAGHELGHSAWNRGPSAQLQPVLQNALLEEIRTKRWAEHQLLYSLQDEAELTTTLLGSQSFELAQRWAQRQAEETFCDFLGLSIFGTTYLDAFVYLLVPGAGGTRSPMYPNDGARLRHLVSAAEALKLDFDDELADALDDSPDPFASSREKGDRYQLELADAAVEAVVGDLVQVAGDIGNQCSESLPVEGKVKQIVGQLTLGVPARDSGGLTNLIAAGWQCRKERASLGPASTPGDRDEMLGELLLKSLEILEIEARVAEART